MATTSEVTGSNVRALRQAVGLTQSELADAMRAIGFRWHRQTVSEIEEGRRPLTLEEVVTVAAYFEMPMRAILVSPGMLLDYQEVQVGDVPVPVGDWVNLVDLVVEEAATDEPPGRYRRAAIDNLTRGLDRPWAKAWRRMGGHPAQAFVRTRENIIARRRALAGPNYVTDEDTEVSTTGRPWGTSISVKLKARQPYIPRDDQERELLDGLVERGGARIVTRQQAYKLRNPGKGKS